MTEIWTHARPAPAPAAYLRSAAGNRIDLVPNRVYVLGRAQDCDLQLDDPGCSRRHARLSVSGGARVVLLQDLGSKNGTYVNDERVADRVELQDGDRIQLGGAVFVFARPPAGGDVPFDTKTSIL